MEKKSLELNLPTDPKLLKISIENIFTGLNKASKSGTFDLKESAQLCHDLDLICQIIDQIGKSVYNK